MIGIEWSHLVIILVVEVLHEDATGEALDASLHPHVILLKVLVADVVLCCRLTKNIQLLANCCVFMV